MLPRRERNPTSRGALYAADRARKVSSGALWMHGSSTRLTCHYARLQCRGIAKWLARPVSGSGWPIMALVKRTCGQHAPAHRLVAVRPSFTEAGCVWNPIPPRGELQRGRPHSARDGGNDHAHRQEGGDDADLQQPTPRSQAIDQHGCHDDTRVSDDRVEHPWHTQFLITSRTRERPHSSRISRRTANSIRPRDRC